MKNRPTPSTSHAVYSHLLVMEDINALDLFKEEMETEEIHLKVNVIHRMKTVILAIGVEETNKKLIPYLECKNTVINPSSALIDREDDEALFAIAEELGKVW